MWRFLFFVTIILGSFSGRSNDFYSDKTEKEKLPRNGDYYTQVRVYPNPCTEKILNVELFSEEIAELKITNIAGKEVFSLKNKVLLSHQRILLENIPNGIYLLILKTKENNVITKKLIVSYN
jgi:hypothetical protein